MRLLALPRASKARDVLVSPEQLGEVIASIRGGGQLSPQAAFNTPAASPSAQSSTVASLSAAASSPVVADSARAFPSAAAPIEPAATGQAETEVFEPLTEAASMFDPRYDDPIAAQKVGLEEVEGDDDFDAWQLTGRD